MEVRWHPGAEEDLKRLSAKERAALLHAEQKLVALSVALGYPHTSAVKGTANLRELRPRRGDSPWRAFFRRIGDILVIGAVGPEANVDPRGFAAAIRAAETRLAEIKD